MVQWRWSGLARSLVDMGALCRRAHAPTRTSGRTSSTATSKSSLMPIDSSAGPSPGMACRRLAARLTAPAGRRRSAGRRAGMRPGAADRHQAPNLEVGQGASRAPAMPPAGRRAGSRPGRILIDVDPHEDRVSCRVRRRCRRDRPRPGPCRFAMHRLASRSRRVASSTESTDWMVLEGVQREADLVALEVADEVPGGARHEAGLGGSLLDPVLTERREAGRDGRLEPLGVDRLGDGDQGH